MADSDQHGLGRSAAGCGQFILLLIVLAVLAVAGALVVGIVMGVRAFMS